MWPRVNKWSTTVSYPASLERHLRKHAFGTRVAALEGRHEAESDPLNGDQAAKAKDRPAEALSLTVHELAIAASNMPVIGITW